MKPDEKKPSMAESLQQMEQQAKEQLDNSHGAVAERNGAGKDKSFAKALARGKRNDFELHCLLVQRNWPELSDAEARIVAYAEGNEALKGRLG